MQLQPLNISFHYGIAGYFEALKKKSEQMSLSPRSHSKQRLSTIGEALKPAVMLLQYLL